MKNNNYLESNTGLDICMPSYQISLLAQKQLDDISACLSNINSPNSKEHSTFLNVFHNMKVSPKPKTLSSQKRILDRLDWDIQDLDSLRKKCKTDGTEPSLSTYDEIEVGEQSSKSYESLQAGKNHIKPFFSNQLSRFDTPTKSAFSKFEKDQSKKQNDLKFIEKALLDQQTNKVLFSVVCETDAGNNQKRLLTREDILKEDPMTLLHFYEKHLQFTKSPYFQPEKLKQVQI